MSSDFKFRALTCEDWKEVTGENLFFDEGLKLKDNIKDDTYTSRSLDSGIPGCQWHRIVLDAEIPDNSTITVFFVTSEEEEAGISSNYDKSITFTKAKDALIQTYPGRYIRLKIDLHREGNDSPVLRQVKIYYESLSYLSYLPAIYQENRESKHFLERFLSIFESSMYDIEETISSIPMFFDPMAAPEEFYRWLADWMSLDMYDLLEEDKKRDFVLNAVKFYKKKGTVSGLASLVSILTGKKCCIKEYKNNVFRSWGMDHDEEDGLKDNEKGNILQCETISDPKNPECTKFYRRISRTIDTDRDKNPGLLTNRGKYCDEIHYVTGKSQKNSKDKQISYFSNSIGIFVFFPFRDELHIDEEQLRKIIDSFLPVFVTFDITYVETSFNEIYPLSRINDEYQDKLIALLDEDINVRYAQGGYIDRVEGWTIFYTHCKGNCSTSLPVDYGRTYCKNDPTYSNFRTVHGSVGFSFNI